MNWCKALRFPEHSHIKSCALQQHHHPKISAPPTQPAPTPHSSDLEPPQQGITSTWKGRRVCFKCGNPGHFTMNCLQGGKESKGRGSSGKTKQVQASGSAHKHHTKHWAPDFLYSSSDEDTQSEVKAVCITDHGCIPQCVRVQVQGVPAYGLIDSGADITIMGGTLP